MPTKKITSTSFAISSELSVDIALQQFTDESEQYRLEMTYPDKSTAHIDFKYYIHAQKIGDYLDSNQIADLQQYLVENKLASEGGLTELWQWKPASLDTFSSSGFSIESLSQLISSIPKEQLKPTSAATSDNHDKDKKTSPSSAQSAATSFFGNVSTSEHKKLSPTPGIMASSSTTVSPVFEEAQLKKLQMVTEKAGFNISSEPGTKIRYSIRNNGIMLMCADDKSIETFKKFLNDQSISFESLSSKSLKISNNALSAFLDRDDFDDDFSPPSLR